MSVTEFKAKCTQVLRELGQKYETVDVTNRGRAIVVVNAPTPGKDNINLAWGALKGKVRHISDDFDEPMGEFDWEACR